MMEVKESCPYARHTGGYSAALDEHVEGADMCTLVDKPCLLEAGLKCETYEDFLDTEVQE